MATAPEPADDMVEQFLSARGHDVPETWDHSANKKQCPDCRGLHDPGAARCSVCGWQPPA